MTMPLLMMKAALLAKIESTYGTDPTPTGSANAMLVSNLQLTPLVAEYAGRNVIRPYLGNDEQIPTNSHVEVSFDIELAGSGAAGTAPDWGPLMKACGMSETISASTSVTYAPVSASFDSVTMYCFYDGTRHKITGARGTVSLKADAKTLPVLQFKFTGIYSTPTDTALPTVTLSRFIKPAAINKDNTTTFTVHSVTAVMSAFTFDVANKIVYRNLVNSESVLLTDRAPTGSCTIEATTVATKDWWTTIKSATTAAVSMVHGTTAGNIVTLTASNTQITEPQFSEQDGILMLGMKLTFVPGSSGNDEFSIALT